MLIQYCCGCLPPVVVTSAAVAFDTFVADKCHGCRYAAKARKIKNKPVQNKNKMGALRQEVEMLRKQNQDYQVSHCSYLRQFASAYFADQTLLQKDGKVL